MRRDDKRLADIIEAAEKIAVNMILSAEQTAPELVRYDTATHDLLALLLRREHRASTPQLCPLAHRAGVIDPHGPAQLCGFSVPTRTAGNAARLAQVTAPTAPTVRAITEPRVLTARPRAARLSRPRRPDRPRPRVHQAGARSVPGDRRGRASRQRTGHQRPGAHVNRGRRPVPGHHLPQRDLAADRRQRQRVGQDSRARATHLGRRPGGVSGWSN